MCAYEAITYASSFAILQHVSRPRTWALPSNTHMSMPATFDWELIRILLVRMADIRDERGNSIYLTDEQGKPAQLVDEFGNAMHLTGVATTIPHLKESSYTGPHPITAPITTTDTPHHAQPISVSHNPLENMGISSSNSVRFIYLIHTVWMPHVLTIVIFYILLLLLLSRFTIYAWHEPY